MSYEDILEPGGGSGIATLKNPGKSQLAVRIDRSNPNHHLWNNRGTWWCHFTLHKPDYTAERIRVSLKTGDLDEARRRRDKILGAIQ